MTSTANSDAPDLMAALLASLERRFEVRFIRRDDSAGQLRYSTIEAAKAGQVKLAAGGTSSHLYERTDGEWKLVEG